MSLQYKYFFQTYFLNFISKVYVQIHAIIVNTNPQVFGELTEVNLDLSLEYNAISVYE